MRHKALKEATGAIISANAIEAKMTIVCEMSDSGVINVVYTDREEFDSDWGEIKELFESKVGETTRCGTMLLLWKEDAVQTIGKLIDQIEFPEGVTEVIIQDPVVDTQKYRISREYLVFINDPETNRFQFKDIHCDGLMNVIESLEYGRYTFV